MSVVWHDPQWEMDLPDYVNQETGETIDMSNCCRVTVEREHDGRVEGYTIEWWRKNLLTLGIQEWLEDTCRQTIQRQWGEL